MIVGPPPNAVNAFILFTMLREHLSTREYAPIIGTNIFYIACINFVVCIELVQHVMKHKILVEHIPSNYSTANFVQMAMVSHQHYPSRIIFDFV